MLINLNSVKDNSKGLNLVEFREANMGRIGMNDDQAQLRLTDHGAF